MNKYILLTKTLFKCGTGMGAASSQTAGKRKGRASMSAPLMAVVLLFCFAPLMGQVFTSSRLTYGLLAPTGQQGSIIGSALSMGAVMTLVFGVSMVVTYFYMATDLGTLLALPISPSLIVAAKFTLCMAYEYLMVVMYTGPMVAGYGVASGGGPLYWIAAVFVCVLLPVIPLSYAAVIIMIIMRVFRRLKNKKVLTVISTVVAVAAALLLSIFGQSLSDQTNAAGALSAARQLNGAYYVFPQLYLAQGALVGENILLLILFIAATALTIFVFLLLARVLYIKGAMGMSEVSSKRRALSRGETRKFMKKDGAFGSYVRVEIAKVLRSPVYFMNGVMMGLLWPLLIGIILIAGSADSSGSADAASSSAITSSAAVASGSAITSSAAVASGSAAASSAAASSGSAAASSAAVASGSATASSAAASGGASSLGNILSYFTEKAEDPMTLGIFMLIMLGLLFLIGSMDLMTPSTISREGQKIWFMKTIPMSYRDQLRAKIASSLPFSMGPTFVYGLIPAIVGIVHGMSPIVLIYMILLTVPSLLLINYIQLMFDLRWPKLVWQNEAVPIKQNFHSLAASAICIAIGAVIAMAAITLFTMLHVNVHVCVLIVIAVITALALVLRPISLRYGERRLEEL
ncbi:MAG: hypothetical protein WCS21_06800 [Lachnospiraceae bacterium]